MYDSIVTSAGSGTYPAITQFRGDMAPWDDVKAASLKRTYGFMPAAGQTDASGRDADAWRPRLTPREAELTTRRSQACSQTDDGWAAGLRPFRCPELQALAPERRSNPQGPGQEEILKHARPPGTPGTRTLRATYCARSVAIQTTSMMTSCDAQRPPARGFSFLATPSGPTVNPVSHGMRVQPAKLVISAMLSPVVICHQYCDHDQCDRPKQHSRHCLGHDSLLVRLQSCLHLR
jgi:hypothetical protein